MKLQNMQYFGKFQLRSSDGGHQTKHLAMRQANLNLLLIFGWRNDGGNEGGDGIWAACLCEGGAPWQPQRRVQRQGTLLHHHWLLRHCPPPPFARAAHPTAPAPRSRRLPLPAPPRKSPPLFSFFLSVFLYVYSPIPLLEIYIQREDYHCCLKIGVPKHVEVWHFQFMQQIGITYNQKNKRKAARLFDLIIRSCSSAYLTSKVLIILQLNYKFHSSPWLLC